MAMHLRAFFGGRFKLAAASVLAAAGLVVGCGGGSGGAGSNFAANVSIAGVAATGAALANAPVYLKDATGHEPAGQSESAGAALVTTDANGQFTLSGDVVAGLVSPILVKVVGKTVLDTGDDAVIVLHSLVNVEDQHVNITPLTEAATTLALKADPGYIFQTPGSVLSSLPTNAASAAGDTLMAALDLNDPQLANLNVFTDSLDANATVDVSDATAAKRHDMLLDSLALARAGAEIRLIDRNGPADDYASQPQLVINTGSATPATENGAPTGVQAPLDATKLADFVTRLNTKFAAGCVISDTTDCNGVLNDTSIFSAAYKHQGMPAEIWLKKWVGTALDIEDFSSLNVSVRAPIVGAWDIGGQYVVRVLLKWQVGSDGDYVFRSMMLTEENGQVVAYGNQKDYFTWIKPRLVNYVDADGTMPFYPRYELGLSLVAGHWYAGVKNAVLGAQFEGVGLPVQRDTNVKNASNDVANPNQLANGVEVFDLRNKWGCQHLSLDPSVYVSQNSDYWSHAWSQSTQYSGSIRWRPDNTTCAPSFDFLRYYGVTADNGQSYNMPTNFVYPKRGDVYKVTLYLNPDKFDVAGNDATKLPLPTGAVDGGNRTFPDGTTKPVWKLVTFNKLQANSFEWQVGGYDSKLFAGVTDESRAKLLTFNEGVDKTVTWTRPRIEWPDGVDSEGKPVYGTFVNFTAGFFSSSYDQMSSTDSYQNASSNALNTHGVELGRKNYREMFGDGLFNSVNNTTPELTRPYYCGLDNAVKHRGALVRVYAQKCTGDATSCNNDAANSNNWITQNSCPVATSVVDSGNRNGTYVDNTDNTIFYRYYAARSRVRANLDRFTFLAANQTTRTFKWSDMVAKENDGAIGLCSAQKGFWAYRGVNVQLLDINGRSLMEQRQVWGDFPNKAASLMGDSTNVSYPAWLRSRDVSRPNLDTDDVYVSFDFTQAELDPYGLAAPYDGQKGFIVPFKKMANGQCVDFDWQLGQ